MASLKINAVDKVYPSGALALYDINLEAGNKEFLVILGGEASGKSTLLRVVAGLEEASSGEIFIGDKNVTEDDPKDRDIAMVFKSNTLYPALNVFDNMGFGLKLRKAPQTLIEQRVKAASNILGLNDVLYRKPKTLTAAQKQRVAIGRAIVREPKLYLFDEPLSGLDGNLQTELLNVIVNLQARMEGTFLYATKNVAEAMSIGSRIAVIKNGVLQQIDSPSNLYDYPANAYVAFLIGSPTINFINKAKITKDESGVYAEEGQLKIKLSESTVKRFAALESYANTEKRVIIGLRPEDASTGGEGFDAEITKTESDKENYFAECLLCGHSLVVRTEKQAESGAKTKVCIDADRLYLFDGETRLTLLGRDAGYVNTGLPQSDYSPMTFGEEEQIAEKFRQKKDKKKKK